MTYWIFFFFFSSRRRHTRLTCDWSSDVCSSDLCQGRVREAIVCGLSESFVKCWTQIRTPLLVSLESLLFLPEPARINPLGGLASSLGIEGNSPINMTRSRSVWPMEFKTSVSLPLGEMKNGHPAATGK